MKRRVVAGLLTVLMALSLCACGSKTKEIKGVPGAFGKDDIKVDVNVPDVDVDVDVDVDEPDVDVDVDVDVDEPDVDVPDVDVPDVDVPDVEVPDVDEPLTYGAGGYDSVENITFAYPEGWVLDTKEGNSISYVNADDTEVIAISASPIDPSLSYDDVIAQVPGVVEMYYGAYDSESTFYVMGREWTMFSYANKEVDGEIVATDIYSLVENRTIIIIAYACRTNYADKTSVVDVVLDSLVVEAIDGDSNDDPVEAGGELEVFNNVTFSLGDDWNYLNESNGTRTYNTTDLSEAFAIYVQNETNYSADAMQDAYQSTIEATFGTDYVLTEDKLGDYIWHHYHYDEVSLIEGYSVDAYVYSDGYTTIYVENAYSKAIGTSGKMSVIFNSLTVN